MSTPGTAGISLSISATTDIAITFHHLFTGRGPAEAYGPHTATMFAGCLKHSSNQWSWVPAAGYGRRRLLDAPMAALATCEPSKRHRRAHVFDGHANHVWQGTTLLASAQAGAHCLLSATASFTTFGTHGDGSAAFAGVAMPYSPADGRVCSTIAPPGCRYHAPHNFGVKSEVCELRMAGGRGGGQPIRSQLLINAVACRLASKQL